MGIQVCSCDPGYSGNDCRFRNCPTGDDPMTLQTVATDSASLDYQVDEVQTITFQDSLGGIVGQSGEFSLKFTSSNGDTWQTWTLDLETVTAISIREALIALPNQAIPDCEVNADGSDAFTVTFSHERTAGDQNLIEIDGVACTDNGCQPISAGLGSHTSTVVETTKGTEENAVCSNRGHCNAEDGTCSCAAGYYGEACAGQTIIF